MVALTDFTFAFEMATTSTPKTASPTYTALTSFVMAGESVTLQRGRGSEQDSTAQAGRANVTLRNTDGRFTMGNGSSPYAPLQLRRPCRWRVRYGGDGNFATAAAASFEDGTTGGWSTSVIGFTAPTISNSATRAFDGTKSLLVTWPTSALSAAGVFVNGLTIGQQYTASAYVWVPAGSPAVRLDVLFTASGANTATTAAWTRINVTFTATATSHFVFVRATSTGAGQTAFVDALQVDEGASLRTFTTTSPPLFDLWQGFVDDWGNKREELTGVARLSMSDRIARAAKNQLAPAIVQEILSDGPFAYYPLNDSGDSFEAQDATGVGRPSLVGYQQAVVGPNPGSFTLGVGGAPGPDAMTMAAFTTGTDPAADTGFMFAFDSVYNVSGTGTTVEGYFYLPDNVRTGAAALIASWPGGTLYVNDTMSLAATASDNTTVVTSTVKVAVGVMNHAAYRQSASGGTVSLTLFLNGVSVATGSYSAASIVNTDSVARIGDGMDGRLSNVAFYTTALSDARIADHANAITSWSGEVATERFNRLCRVGGLASGQYTTSGTTSKQMSAQPTDGKSLLDALTEVARVEGGSVYVNDAGVLTFACAATRYGTTVGVTLDATKAGQVDPDTEIPTDDADLINDSTATLPNGTRYRTVDATSVSAYDTHDETETLYTSSDAVALNWTQWRVAQFKTPTPRLTEVPVNVVGYANSGGDVAALLNAEVGTKLQITNLPSDTAATSTLTLLIEGVRDELRKDEWVRTFTTSPIGLNDSGWVLGTSALGLTANLLY